MSRFPLTVALLTAFALAPGPEASARPEREAAPSSATAALEWRSGLLAWPNGLHMVVPSTVRPERMLLPVGLRHPRYARLDEGVLRGLTVVLDVTEGSERLWADVDRDGDVSEHDARRWAVEDGVWRAWDSIEVKLGRDSEPTALDLEFRFFPATEGRGEAFGVRALAHRVGTVVLAGRVRPIALVDANGNLRFDDEGEDHLYVDVDGDGVLRQGPGSYEAFPVGTPLRINREGWVAAIPDEVGTTVEFLRAGTPPAPRPRRWVPEPPPAVEDGRAPAPEAVPALKARYERQLLATPAAAVSALEMMGRTGSDAALEFLLEVLRRDAPDGVRDAAVRALGNPRFAATGGPVLEKIAADGQSDHGATAVRSLHYMAHPQRERAYRAALESGSREARREAAFLLGYVPGDAAKELLLRLLAGDPDETVRHAAYRGARGLAQGPPREAMLAMLQGDDDEVAALALRDLHYAADRSLRPLALEAADRARAAPAKFRALGLAAVDVLAPIADREIVAELIRLRRDPVLGERVVERLGATRDAFEIDLVSAHLGARQPDAREFAARILAGVPVPQVTNRLIALTDTEKDERVLEAVLIAIGEHGSRRSSDALLQIARNASPALRPAVLRALANVGMDAPKVRAYFLKLLTAREWEERLLALEACSAADDPAYVPVVVQSLGHVRWQVRLAAADAMAGLGSREAVEPLIEALEKETHQRNREALRKALTAITGVNYYDDAGLWKKWYAAVGRHAGEGGRPPAQRSNTSEAPPGKFYGIIVRSHHVVFVLDRSGSMEWPDPGAAPTPAGDARSKMEVAVEQLLGSVGRLPDKARANVVLFGNSFTRWGSQLRKLSLGNRRALAQYLKSRQPDGATNLFDALEAGMQDPEADTIFLLSDGAANVGKYTDPDRIARKIRDMNRMLGIRIHCVAVGHHSSLLMRLARESGGTYVRH